VFGLKRRQRFGAALARINVEREEARFSARRNADIRIFPDLPPLLDFRFISRGVMNSVFRTRVFAGVITNRFMARVFAPVLASVLMAWMLANPRTSDPLLLEG
jgi:hypothetical protein